MLRRICVCLLKISMLEELLDSLRLMDLGICLVIEGEWFEHVCMYVGVLLYFL